MNALNNIIAGPDSARPSGIPRYLTDLAMVIDYDAWGNPAFSCSVPNYGLSDPSAATDIARLGDELIGITRAFSDQTIDRVMRHAWGLQPSRRLAVGSTRWFSQSLGGVEHD